MSKEKLKLCPCCGGKAIKGLPVPQYRDSEFVNYEICIGCKECGISISVYTISLAEPYITKAVAAGVKIWNRRVKNETRL